MTYPAVVTLACCVAALVALRAAFRNGGFWTHIGALFVVAMVVFHGVAEVLATLVPEAARYRPLLGPGEVDRWLVWAGPAILALTGSYLLTLGPARRDSPAGDIEATARSVKFFDWRYCLLATLPLYLVALSGRGFVPGSTTEGGYFEAGITSQFLQMGVVFTAFAIAVRTQRFVPVLMGQSFALLLLGQRLAVVAGMAMLWFLLARHGFRATRRQVVALVAIGAVGSLMVSAARVSGGREEFAGGSDARTRVSALGGGATSLLTGSVYGALADDFLYRIDGNAFPALIMGQQPGTPYAGFATVANSIQLAVPSFLNPTKTASRVTEREEKQYLIEQYGLPRSIDFLPTYLGAAVAYLGPANLLLLATLFGVAIGLVDRWLKTASPMRSVVAVGLVACVMYYERGVQVVPLTMRGAILLAGLVFALHKVTETLGRDTLRRRRIIRSSPARARTEWQTQGPT